MQGVVLEISSSDDEGETIAQSERSLKRPLEPTTRYGGHENGDEDDEVTVIDKLPCFVEREKQNWRFKRGKSGKKIEDMENDCWVLDCDPDKIVSDPEAYVDASEDLVVTAEKGPVACRDFPHPRHLCVKFPFKSTPHEKHCGLCHCYVCDKPAPCSLWGKGNASGDHCHSSDKEEKWTKLRNYHKMPKAPSMALPSSFNTILSLTTMRSTVPVGRSNQASTGPVFSYPQNVSTGSAQSTICTGPDQHSSSSSANSVYPISRTEAVSTSGYVNLVPSQSGSRFESTLRRNTSNLGFHGHGAMGRRSNGSQMSSAENKQRQRDSVSMFFSNNPRGSTLDSCSTTQRHAVDIHSTDQMHVEDMLSRNFSCTQSHLADMNLNKLWEYLLGSDSEESNSTQNDSFRDMNMNRTIEPSTNLELTNMIMTQPNGSGEKSSSCVASTRELQLLPLPSVSEGVSNSLDNFVQWPVVHQMPVTTGLLGTTTTEQCMYTSDYQSLSYDWFGTDYPPFHTGGTMFQVESEITVPVQTCNYVPAQPSTRHNGFKDSQNNTDQSTDSCDIETVVPTPQAQHPEWQVPVVAPPDARDMGVELSSEQDFAASPAAIGTLQCFDVRNPWEALTLGYNHGHNLEST